MAQILVNGRNHDVPEGERLLPELRTLGFKIPSLCFHLSLTPSAACKLCVVEVKVPEKPPRPRLSCATRIKGGMEITTDSALVYQMRSKALGELLKLAPEAEAIHKIGREFGLSTGIRPDGCIRCRLCVRVCSEIIGARALKIEKQGELKYVVPAETGSCIGCLTCTNICPTGAIRYEDDDQVRTVLIRDEVVARHTLERCDICGRQFATEKFLEHVKASDGAHPEEKSEHTHCPTCAKLYYRKNLNLVSPRLVK
jgi:bidirectional [NiFe] hydrogenase diaphorase subunit